MEGNMLYKILGVLGVGVAFFTLCFMTITLLTGSLLARVSDPTKPLLLPYNTIVFETTYKPEFYTPPSHAYICFEYSNVCRKATKKDENLLFYLEEVIEMCAHVDNSLQCNATPFFEVLGMRES